MTTLAYGQKVPPEFRGRVLRIAARIACDPSHLMACMAFESRLDPKSINAVSGASGLINFMPSTAIALGTTIDAIRAMTALQQLDLVEKYFAPYAGRLRDLADVYMAIFSPKGIGQPDDFVLYAAPSAAYAQNRALDANNDGKITKAEAASFPMRRLAEGMQFATEERDDSRTDTAAPIAPHDEKGKAAMLPFMKIFATLMPSVVELFGGRAQSAIQKATGADDTVAQSFMQNLFTGLQQAVGIPITNDATAIQAVGKLTAAANSDDAAERAAMKAKIAQLEEHSLDYLDKIGGMIDKVAAVDQANRVAADTSYDKAAVRVTGAEGWKLRFAQASFTQKTLGYAIIVIAALIALMQMSLFWLPDLAVPATQNLLGQLVILEVALITGLVSTFRDQNGYSFGGTVQDHAAPLGAAAINQALDERAARSKTA